MKYLLLPIHLIKFWFLESPFVILRSWKNMILLLEEDLAVILMWKLLFVPLFHDSSFIGKILSFIFRLSRILIGLFSFTGASILMILLAIYWFLLPVLVFFDLGIISLINKTIFLSGIGLFLIHIISSPHKKLWSIRQAHFVVTQWNQDKQDNFWGASLINKKDLDLKKLFSNHLTQILLEHLELKTEDLIFIQLTDKDKVGQDAFKLAKISESPYINANHFLVAALQNTSDAEQKLIKHELSVADFVHTLKYLEKQRRIWRRIYIWDDDFTVHHLKGVNRGWLGAPTTVLDQVSEDLTKTALSKGFPNFVGKPTTIKELVHILSQENNSNVIIVGPPGAGKSSLIHFLAKQIVMGDAPSSLATKRLVLLDTTRLLSGMNSQGELAERIKTIFEEVKYAQNVILVIDEIHNLGIGEAGTEMNLYSLITPYLDSSNFQFIATTDPNSYSKIIEKNGSFARIFSKIELTPATKEETLEILMQRAINFEKDKKITITYPSLKLAVDLAQKFIHDRVLPDSAINILNEAVAREESLVNRQLIKELISQKVHVPIMDVGNLDKKTLLNLEEKIHQRMIDQEEVVRAVADSLRRGATGIREGGRPIGSFLFVGPTGVGKTELAKTLLDVYFEGKGGFVRIDMSEYQNSESVDRLIGASGEGGILTEEIRRNPFSLTLLDEFEKADPKILTLFLQILDDGRLTDGAGRLVDFTNTIIIATSNAASLTIARGLANGEGIEELDKKVNEELLQIFKPELINRFDDVVIFKPLSKEDLQKIVKLKLKSLQDRLRTEGYIIEFNDLLVNQLAQKGFDPVMGARPLRRLIQDTLEARISRLILENKLVKGNHFRVGAELLE